jgi:hypothetical protein
MQIGFTKKGLRGGRPSNLESNYIIPQCAVCVSNGEPHQTKQTPIIYQRASQKKKLNKENRNEEEKSSTKKKEKKWSILSILTRAAMYIQSAWE